MLLAMNRRLATDPGLARGGLCRRPGYRAGSRGSPGRRRNAPTPAQPAAPPPIPARACGAPPTTTEARSARRQRPRRLLRKRSNPRLKPTDSAARNCASCSRRSRSIPTPCSRRCLPAAAYPLEIVQAERWLEKNQALVAKSDFSGIDSQKWDPAVKAMARFPDLIKKMSEDLPWTTDLGDAIVNQPQDVAAAIQQLRARGGELGRAQVERPADGEAGRVEHASSRRRRRWRRHRASGLGRLHLDRADRSLDDVRSLL